MKTSSFYLYSGPGRISIARTAPRRVTAGLKAYRTLAPGTWLFDPSYKNYAAYRERYFHEILARLDPQQAWDELHVLAGEHEPVLLCHEHLLKAGDWCHRRMVAEWLGQALGAEIPEMAIEQKAKSPVAQLNLLMEAI